MLVFIHILVVPAAGVLSVIDVEESCSSSQHVSAKGGSAALYWVAWNYKFI